MKQHDLLTASKNILFRSGNKIKTNWKLNWHFPLIKLKPHLKALKVSSSNPFVFLPVPSPDCCEFILPFTFRVLRRLRGRCEEFKENKKIK